MSPEKFDPVDMSASNGVATSQTDAGISEVQQRVCGSPPYRQYAGTYYSNAYDKHLWEDGSTIDSTADKAAWGQLPLQIINIILGSLKLKI